MSQPNRQSLTARLTMRFWRWVARQVDAPAPAPAAPAALDSWLTELLRNYPGGARLDLERTRDAWAALSDAERFSAVAHLGAWRAEIEASQFRRRVPPPAEYLAERKWQLIAPVADTARDASRTTPASPPATRSRPRSQEDRPERPHRSQASRGVR